VITARRRHAGRADHPFRGGADGKTNNEASAHKAGTRAGVRVASRVRSAIGVSGAAVWARQHRRCPATSCPTANGCR